MAEVMRAPQQFKQPSRKGKKAWRKNVDVTEIEGGLDNVRQEIISGGIISGKSAAELYAVDTTGSETLARDYQKRRGQLLKADKIISERSSTIPAVNTRKRKTIADLLPEPKRRDGKYVSCKELQRLKDVAYGVLDPLRIFISLSDADRDPWAEQPQPPPETDILFVPLPPAKKEPPTLKRAPESLAVSGRPFAAVKRPSAGKSYNPLFEDWQALLTREGAKEVASETERRRIEAAHAERLEKALAEAARPEKTDDAHGADSEYESAWESEWEGIQSGAEDLTSSASWMSKKRPERKTPAERNKVNRRKIAERQARWEAAMKKRDEQNNRIKSIARDLKAKDAQRTQHVALDVAARSIPIDSSEDEDQSGRKQTQLRRAKLGRPSVPESPLEVVLTDELQDSLRALRPEGDLLKDRFRNLLVNGKMEPRRAIFQPKKAKKHVSEKWSYADFKLP